MVCVYCGHSTAVNNSRPSIKSRSTWRRRECKSCGSIFTTRETVDYESSLRVQKDKALEPFYRDKLLISVYGSLSHRKTALSDAGAVADTVTIKLLDHSKRGLLSSQEIVEVTLSVLRRFDKAAATHYQAHNP